MVAAAALLVACGGGGDDAPATDSSSPPGASNSSGGGGNTTNVSTGGGGAAATATRGTSSTSSAMDACQLVTKADAERTLGEPVNPGEGEQRRNNTSTCTYVSTGNYGAHVVFVYAGKGPNERPAYDLAKRTLSRPEPIQGLGDDAFAINLDAPVTQIHFVKGDSYVTVAVTHLTATDRAQRARALAAVALANLR